MGEHSEGKALNKKVKGVKFKMARIRKEYKMTEKNVEYIEEVKEKNNLKYSSEALELINGFFVISEYGRLATTEDIIAPALPRAIDLVDKRRENSMRFR